MTYSTQLTGRRPMPIPQFMITMLAAFVLVFMLSSPARAQWTTGTNINNTNSGIVSVGTTSPGGDKLITAGNILAGDITSHTQLYSGYDSQANVIMELGYGTASADTTPLASLVLSKNLTSANNPIGVITFANSSIANGNEKRLSAITSWTDGATNSGTLQFLTSSAGVLNERMRITSGGNIGIGTTSPVGKLEVTGSIYIVALRKLTLSLAGQWGTITRRLLARKDIGHSEAIPHIVLTLTYTILVLHLRPLRLIKAAMWASALPLPPRP